VSKWIVTGLVLLLFVVVQAALTPVKIPSPAATGMNSIFDVQELRLTDATFLQNARIDEKIGAVSRRRGTNQIGDNTAQTFVATAFFVDNSTTEDVNDYRQIVGVGFGINSVNVTDDNSVTPDTTLTFTFASADTSVLNFAVSDQNGSGIQDSVISYAGIANSKEIDVANVFGRPVFADGETPPMIYSDRFLATANDAHARDTSYFNPWMMSLGLEAPGQLRVGIVHEVAPPKGAYRYNLSFTNNTSGTGIPSAFIFPDSQKVFITLFENEASKRGPDDTVITIAVELWKQKAGGPWYLLDTVNYWGKEDVYYIDTFSDNRSAFGAITVRAKADFDFNIILNATTSRPGAIKINHLLTDSTFYDQSTDQEAGLGEDSLSVFVDSFYAFAYAYYDPYLDIEGPIGPVSYGRLNSNDCTNCSGGTDTLLVRGQIPYSKFFERPRWMRFYRTASPFDTLSKRLDLKLYGLFELRAKFPYPKDTTALQSIILGHVQDDSLSGASLFWADCSDCDYRDNDILFNELGDALVRPPFISGIEIPFSDIEFEGGRLWGIGDPIFPERLYYSDFDRVYNINATQFISLDEESTAAIIAIEKVTVGRETFLYALKNNSIYAIIGYDPEHDLTYQVISENVGALSKEAVINTGDEIFFMSPDMKIYSLSITGGRPKEISQPIEDYIDTLFTNFSTALTTMVTYRLYDKVIWADTANVRALVFNTRSRIWMLYKYDAAVRYVGSFRYDSLNAPAYDEFDYWLYQNDAGENYRVEQEVAVDSTATAFRFPFVYQTPYIGDGEFLYQIVSAKVIANWDDTDTLIVYIVDNEGTFIDSIKTLSDSRSSRLYDIGMPFNQSSYLALRLKSGEDIDSMIIHSVVTKHRRIGKVEIQ